jgi:hypothetical protein
MDAPPAVKRALAKYRLLVDYYNTLGQCGYILEASIADA